MCGRFTLTVPPYSLFERLQIEEPPPAFDSHYNFCPSQRTVVVTQNRHLALMRWGLIPSWAKDSTMAYKMINARAETLSEKPSFKNLLRSHRCLIPADSFYEWKSEGKIKRPYRILLHGEEVFGMAGLWDSWKDPDGQMVTSFTVITTEANETVSPLHDRMPVILRPKDEELWLSTAPLKPEQMQEILSSYPDEDMEAYPVSPMVNSVKNDGPECTMRAFP